MLARVPVMSAANATVTFPDTGQSPSDFEFERVLFISNFIGCMAWGI
jgi:hypothetical protein